MRLWWARAVLLRLAGRRMSLCMPMQNAITRSWLLYNWIPNPLLHSTSLHSTSKTTSLLQDHSSTASHLLGPFLIMSTAQVCFIVDTMT